VIHVWLWAIVVLAAVAAPAPASAQRYVQFEGIVRWLSGQTLVVTADVPTPPAYVISGNYLIPVPGPRPVVNVDVSQLPQTDYAFMRPGERLTVVGYVSSDGYRVVATALIRRPEEAP
jgi:hypothetical protein